MNKPILYNDLITDFKKCGLKQGDNISVHVALSKTGWILGGPEVFLRALFNVIGPEGTVIMPTQTWKNLDPSTGVHWEQPEKWWPVIRDNWPAYNPDITPSIGMGAVAEMLRTWPGAKRSMHPARSFAAVGSKAEYLVENHDLENIFGENSPLDKLYKINGKILLVGVGFNKNTSLHVAETRANYKNKHNVNESSAILVNGKREWVTYSTLAVDDEDFTEMEKEYKKSFGTNVYKVGNADTMLLSQPHVIDWAVEWIEENRN